MFKIKVADTVIEIDNINGYVKEYCSAWLCDGAPDFRIRVSNEEILSYIRGKMLTEAGAERILVYRKIAAILAQREKFLLHSSVISYKGQGVAFVASRGVGKTTHAMLWKHTFWDDVEFVNGDKPIISCEDGRCIAHATPWCGKEGFCDRESAPLSAIVFIERGEKPEISSITPQDAVVRLQNQTVAPESRCFDTQFADNIAQMLKTVPLYVAKVNTDKESAIKVKNYIFK